MLVDLSDTNSPSRVWADLRKKNDDLQRFVSVETLPYTAANGKTYQMDFTDDKGLYLIAQYLRATKTRP